MAGDGVIKVIADVLRRTKRQTDIAGRYGGEEFGIILPGTSAELAGYFTERLRNRIEQETVFDDQRGVAKVTISLGVCEWNPKITDYKSWLEKSDLALYESKKQGRNTTTIINNDDCYINSKGEFILAQPVQNTAIK